MTERTVTVATSDLGIVSIPEPAWCTGTAHDFPDDLVHRPLASEIAHTGPSIDIMVGTERGPRRLLELLLWQDAFPKPTYAHGAEVYVVAHLLDGDHFDFDVAGLEGLVADLLEAAGRVRLVARRLASETRGGAL
jgi:hypothetical protein